MRNGFLGALLSLLLAAPLTSAQTVAPDFGPVAGESLPRPSLDDRPNVAPNGYRFYGNADYLLWWTQKDRPVSSLTAGGTDPLLHEATDFGPLFHQGARGVLGLWLDPQQHYAVEVGGLWLCDRSPGWRQGGGIKVEEANRLWGAETNARCELVRAPYVHLDLLGGFRFLSFDESLAITERDAANTVTSDRCGTRNRFFGGQLGLEVEAHYGDWSVDLWGKVALGANCETINLNGTTVSGGRATPGGLVTSPTNSGRRSHDEFAVVPEVGITVSYQLLHNIRLTAGYTLLYLSDAARPGEQLNALRASPKSSVFSLPGGEFWGQGISLGIEFRF